MSRPVTKTEAYHRTREKSSDTQSAMTINLRISAKCIDVPGTLPSQWHHRLHPPCKRRSESYNQENCFPPTNLPEKTNKQTKQKNKIRLRWSSSSKRRTWSPNLTEADMKTTYPYQQYEKWMELGKENFSLDTKTLWFLTSFAACLVLQRLQYRAVRTNRSVL